MNGYFQIQIDQKGVSIILSPPIGEGEKIRAGELKEYLDRIGVPYDTKAINSHSMIWMRRRLLFF